MYEGMKKAFGPSINKIAPLKAASGDTITGERQTDREMAEHNQELYSRENIVADVAVENSSPLPVMDELDIPPTKDLLACGKAAGSDDIPPEAVIAGKHSALSDHLYELLRRCWEEGSVPQDIRDANIVTLYKHKGERSECNNYRVISLLNIVGKHLPTLS